MQIEKPDNSAIESFLGIEDFPLSKTTECLALAIESSDPLNTIAELEIDNFRFILPTDPDKQTLTIRNTKWFAFEVGKVFEGTIKSQPRQYLYVEESGMCGYMITSFDSARGIYRIYHEHFKRGELFHAAAISAQMYINLTNTLDITDTVGTVVLCNSLNAGTIIGNNSRVMEANRLLNTVFSNLIVVIVAPTVTDEAATLLSLSSKLTRRVHITKSTVDALSRIEGWQKRISLSEI